MTEVVVSSPRKLSLTSKRASVSFVDENVGSPKHQELWRKQGTKPVEVHAFVGAISAIVGFVIFVIWAYVPEPWLHSLGITYYPDKYWAVALPGFVMVTIGFVVFGYVGLNHLATPPPDSLNTLFDEHSRSPVDFSTFAGEKPIEPIADLPIALVNQAMFSS